MFETDLKLMLSADENGWVELSNVGIFRGNHLKKMSIGTYSSIFVVDEGVYVWGL